MMGECDNKSLSLYLDKCETSQVTTLSPDMPPPPPDIGILSNEDLSSLPPPPPPLPPALALVDVSAGDNSLKNLTPNLPPPPPDRLYIPDIAEGDHPPPLLSPDMPPPLLSPDMPPPPLLSPDMPPPPLHSPDMPPPPLLSPDMPPPSSPNRLISLDNLLPSDEEEPVGTSEALVDCEESLSEDDLDFTDTDFAIDKMLDELQDFSLELGIDIPENKKGDFIMLSPVQPKVPELENNVDHLRLSIANFEDNIEFDLDALLEDLCAMEREITQSAACANKPKEPNPVLKVEVENDDIKAQNTATNVENDQTISFTLSSGTSPTVMVTHDVKERLEILQTELESKELSPEEQEAKIKAEKMKIALEKMKAASVQKLFIKVYNSEQRTNKTMMIDQTWTARDVQNKMIQKDDVEPGLNWCILEKLPTIFMERILEDSEFVLPTVLDWSRETENGLVFVNRRDKYMLFRNPQNFLLNDLNSNEDAKLAEKSKDILLQEFFSKESTQIPNSEGVLWLREGSRKWIKHFFALRASGIYYNPKGKQKSRDLVCLASFEHNNVYLGVGFKKKFKAPTDHVICLKHPKVQTIKSKHIYCLCAEDAKTKEHWVTYIRMAKYGYSIYDDYLKTQKELESVLLAGINTREAVDANENKSQLSTIPSDSTMSLDSYCNKRLGTERRQGTERNVSCTVNRITGKQNTLGIIFSTAWSKGVVDNNEADFSSSMSSIQESPWSPANSYNETPSYDNSFNFSNTVSNNPVNVAYQRQNADKERSLDTSQSGDPKTIASEKYDSDLVDDMLNQLAKSTTNGIPPPPPPPPLPGDRSIPSPAPSPPPSPPPPPQRKPPPPPPPPPRQPPPQP